MFNLMFYEETKAGGRAPPNQIILVPKKLASWRQAMSMPADINAAQSDCVKINHMWLWDHDPGHGHGKSCPSSCKRWQWKHIMWPSRPKWVALLLVHVLGTATFPKGVPYIDFGFSTKSVSPVFSTSEKYTCYTQRKFISVISKCLKQATLQ